MLEDTTDTDDPPAAEDDSDDDDPSRRRLIRWIAVLAFGVPVVVELLTFGGLINNRLLPGGDDGAGAAGDGTATATDTATATATAGAVGVDDELLPDTPPAETVEVSEVVGDAGSRTYVLRVRVENTTDSTVELRLTGVTLRDGTELDSVSSTGSIRPGATGAVTAAWDLPTDSMPAAVDAVSLRDGAAVADRSVPLKRPPIRG